MTRSQAFNENRSDSEPDFFPRSALLAALLSFLVTGTLYLLTMNRTYGFIDSGELAAVATTLGIAHPTGYPTFTLLGHLAVRLVPWVRPVLVLNALSALWSALGVGLAVLLIHYVLQAVLRGVSSEESRKGATAKKKTAPRAQARAITRELSPLAFAAIAFFSGTFIGLSTTWWSQGTGFEVYALHAVFLGLVTLTFFRYLEDLDPRNSQPRFTRWGLLFSFSVGLSFTNHLSMITLAPALLFLFFRATRLPIRSFHELIRLAPGFLLGLLPYAYLPIRASMHPRLNWGDPDTLDRFLEHVSGEQFHFAFAFVPRVFRQQTQYLANTLVNDTSVVGLLIAALGIVVLLRRARVHALWTGILFLTCAVVSGLYDINDIGNYYLPVFLALGVWVAVGLAFLAERFSGTGAVAVGALLVGLNAGRHYHPMDEHDNTMAEDLTWNVLHNLPPNAVIISNHWDYWVSASFYAQQVEGLRTDVVVLDPEGLRSEPYLENLQRDSPELLKPVSEEVGRFVEEIRELRKHPTMTAPEAEAYYSAYYAMISTLIDRNPKRPFFVTEWTDPRMGEGFSRVPMKLAYLLTKDEGYLEQEFPEFRFRPWTNRVDPYVVKISEIYTTSLLARARYEEKHERPDVGRKYGMRALSFDPGFRERDVPDFPLHIEDQLKEVLRNYLDLKSRIGTLSEPWFRREAAHAPKGPRPDPGAARERSPRHPAGDLLLRERAGLPARPGGHRPRRRPRRKHRRAPGRKGPETRAKCDEPGDPETLEEVPAVRNPARERSAGRLRLINSLSSPSDHQRMAG
jgi:Protein O-mannosyl-transferase TMEM260-like